MSWRWWCVVVMTMHKLSAGAGYRYLLKSIATGDCQQPAGDPASAYYTQAGNPPGHWLGRGLAGLGATSPSGDNAPGMRGGAVVHEEAMGRLFGHGRDPLTGAALGRAYRTSVPAAERVAAAVAALPKGMDPVVRDRAVEAIARVELARDAPHAVAGFDLTFTVMKSVSTLWALTDPVMRLSIYNAHTSAVAQALEFLQDRALFTRTGSRGCRQERTRGGVAAAFDHWDSRAGDPNLHTHVVLANKVQGVDGAWRSVDSRALHHAVVAVSEVYEALLVDEVARRLPVRWGWRSRGPRRSPAFELTGIDDDLLRSFSRRATQIDTAMTSLVAQFAARHGRGPNRIEIVRLRQQVTVATRPAKHIHPLAELLARWRRRATQATGATPEELTARVLQTSRTRPVRVGDVPPPVVEHVADVVLAGVRERRSTWTRWNVLAEAARVTKGLISATPDDRLAVMDAITDNALSRCVSLEAPAVFTSTGRYAQSDGRSVFDRPGEHPFTDRLILDAETRLLSAAGDSTGPTARVLDSALTAPGSGGTLAVDQQLAVRQLAESGRRVDLLVGPAGSGKTTTLAVLRRAWEQEHGPGSVIGLAPSQAAAANLAGALGITCQNTAKWMHESTGPGAAQRGDVIDRLVTMRAGMHGPKALAGLRMIDTAITSQRREQERWTMRPGQLVIVDEASLAGTLTLDALTTQATTAGAKLLLVGDHAQLSAVDAGGVFGLLATRTDAARLRTLWRFTNPWEADATRALRVGDARVLEEYELQGRIVSGPGESMLEAAYTAWAADVAAGHSTILVAPDAATVTALNTRAHNDRVQDGLVAEDGVTTHHGVQISAGDRVVTRLNDRTLAVAHGFVRNGDLWDVRAVQPDGSLVVTTAPAAQRLIGSAADDPVVLPSGYVAEHVDLAYATTTHRAQGITVDRSHVLAHPGMTRENLYVAMTRGRETNRVYVSLTDVDLDCDDLPDPHAPGDAHDVLTGILATTGAEQSATATIAQRLDEATSPARLNAIRGTLYADAAQARWTARLAELGLATRVIDRMTRSPDAGRLFATLDRVAAVAGPNNAIVRDLVWSSPDGADPAAAMLAASRSWLLTQVAHIEDLPPVRNQIGLDSDGLALLAQVDDLLESRQRAFPEADADERHAPRPDHPPVLQATRMSTAARPNPDVSARGL